MILVLSGNKTLECDNLIITVSEVRSRKFAVNDLRKFKDKTLRSVMEFFFFNFPYKSKGSKKRKHSFSISILFDSNTKHLKCTSFVKQNAQNEASII